MSRRPERCIRMKRCGWDLRNSLRGLKMQPVNYGMRFSGPVTASPPDAQPAIKARSSPAAFPTSLCVPSSAFTLLRGPIVPQASVSSTFPCRPLFPTEGYDAASEKTASARPPALIRSTPPLRAQDSLVDRSSVGLPLAMTLMQCPGVSGRR